MVYESALLTGIKLPLSNILVLIRKERVIAVLLLRVIISHF